MKKLLAVFMCMIICLSLSGCNQYEYVSNAIDNFDVGYSEDAGDAFVSTYNWDGTEDAMNIVIPEEYNGLPITALGGYTGLGVPSPFGIELTESYSNSLCSEANMWGYSSIFDDIESVETRYLNFNIHVSKNIEQLVLHSMDWIYEGTYYDYDEGNHHLKIVLVFLYSFTCDKENETFYAKDGKLYYKENNELVSDILYYDYDFSSYRDNTNGNGTISV